VISSGQNTRKTNHRYRVAVVRITDLLDHLVTTLRRLRWRLYRVSRVSLIADVYPSARALVAANLQRYLLVLRAQWAADLQPRSGSYGHSFCR